MKLTQLIQKFKIALIEKGEKLHPTPEYGPLTEEISEKYDVEIILTPRLNAPAPDAPATKPAWKKEAEKMKGKGESNSAFVALMTGNWPLVRLKLKTIIGSSAAWCGLAVAVWLNLAGMPVQPDGAGARNWAKYGQEVSWKQNGLPEGAIVHINHVKCGNGSSNHVTLVNKDYAAKDIIVMEKDVKGAWVYKAKPGVYFEGLGGNQSNQVKVSSFPVAHICAVRWPLKDKAGNPMKLPAPVQKTLGSLKSAPSESTR